MEGSEECVKVAINIRPLITSELLLDCTDCVTVVPGEPQVQIGGHAFTYDHVYGSSGTPLSLLFDECVAPLVEALFHGYNATVLAYGQTGSGKTYTMGTNYTGAPNSGGIIPQVMDAIFRKVDAMKDNTEIFIKVSFIEIFKEEVFDLLESHPNAPLKYDVCAFPKPTFPSRAPIQIRETANGGITLAGVLETEVTSKEEMASCLMRGSLSRATGSTNMNSQSSRSHAIFTISLEQKSGDDILFSKLHLVDLAGSERAKRTGAGGSRLKEGIHINRGLLALGNVISALGDERKRKDGGHVPYRDSKLTRLLQDSLGGNSKTVMIACISPADRNAEETINTLKYANRARNIQNKAVINRDPAAAEMQKMRSLLEQCQAELLYYRGGGVSHEELQDLRHRLALLESNNIELRHELRERQVAYEHIAKCALDAQIEKDELILKIESARSGNKWEDVISSDKAKELDLVKSYVQKVHELETQLLLTKSSSETHHSGCVDCLLEKDSFLPGLGDTSSDYDDKCMNVSGELEYKEQEHSTLQDKLGKELQELDRRLEQKEAEMIQFTSSETSVIKQQFERKLLELEQEKKALLREIEVLRLNLANISSASDESTQKLKDDYLHKLNMLESQVSELKKKQEAQSQLLRQKQKSDESAKRLQDEIQRIKTQKVQLQNKIKQESEQFRLWKAIREKEILQLKKEGRRNEYEMRKWMALHQRQQKVVQRKTEEAALAQKRLKELMELKKAGSRGVSGAGNGNGFGIEEIEHELEVLVRVHEVRKEYERQLQVRTAMANELATLKEESEMYKKKIVSDCPQTMSPGARSYRISALESMLAATSTTIVSMASQLSEAEERVRMLNGKARWNHVQTVAQSKNVMSNLFNLALSARRELRDKEASCREKDSIINELKGKVVKLSSTVQYLERKVAELCRTQMLTAKKSGEAPGAMEDEYYYNLRKGPRASQLFNHAVDLVVDMDTSESDGEYDTTLQSSDDDYVPPGVKVERTKSNGSYHVAKPGYEKFKSVNNNKVEPDEVDLESQPKPIEICCTCSKSSSCKTKKCECRAGGKPCGSLCGCMSTKCANQDPSCNKRETEDGFILDITESGGSSSSADIINDQKHLDLASHAAILLQEALEVKPKIVNEDKRKPLSDIGNSLVNTNASKPNRRKKWRESTIQLVPTEPVPMSKPEKKEVPRSKEDIPLKLPRAMNCSSVDNNPPLVDRNSIKIEESAGTSKEAENTARQRSPARSSKVLDDKENHMM